MRWLLETRLKFVRVAANGQRLEGSSGVMSRSGLWSQKCFGARLLNVSPRVEDLER